MEFHWMTGFECSSFPQIGMDELELTQHYAYWASDLVRVRDLGISFIRYGIPWDRVNIRPHEYDWRWTDQVMDLLHTLDFNPIIDLYHFGSPLWIERGLMHPLFADFQAEWAREFARRYEWVQWYTPTNEPYIMSSFAGDFGHWYPFLRGPENFGVTLKDAARGLCMAWEEIEKVRPDARMMVSDTHEYWHPLDVVGVDYYPHSEHQVRSDPKGVIETPHGRLADETAQELLGFAKLVKQYFDHFRHPIILAETGAPGDDERKIAWLDASVQGIRQVREEGVPVIGIVWWGR